MFGLASTNTLLLLAAVFCALCYLAICARPRKTWLKTIVKTGSVLLLAAIALSASNVLLLAAALFACAVGDYFLSREGDEAFISGVGSFAIGHLAYIVLFWIHPSSDLYRITAGWPLAAALVILGILMIVLLFGKAGKLRWAILAYVPVIVGMGIMAISIPFEGALAFVLPAALLFIFSDFVLAQEMFVLPEGHRARRYTPYIVWSSYWLAQGTFLLAFLNAS